MRTTSVTISLFALLGRAGACVLMACVLTGAVRAQAAAGEGRGARRKLIIDQDSFGPGGPNLQPILMALNSPDVEVLGITVESGDGWQDEDVAHLLRMLELVGRTEVPVYRGAVYPLVNTMAATERWEGMHGAIPYKGAWMKVWPAYNNVARTPYHDNAVIPPMPEGVPTTKVQAEPAAVFLARAVARFPGQVTVMALGPMTNLALAQRLDERFGGMAKELVCMCGSFNPRAAAADEFSAQFVNSPRSNFNDRWDPEAAHIAMHGGWKRIVMVPTDATTETKLTAAIQKASTASGTLAAKYVAAYPSVNYPMWDELAFALWEDPALVAHSDVLAVDLGIDPSSAGYGATLSWPKGGGPGLGEPDAEVVRGVKVREFERMYVRLVGGR